MQTKLHYNLLVVVIIFIKISVPFVQGVQAPSLWKDKKNKEKQMEKQDTVLYTVKLATLTFTPGLKPANVFPYSQ